MLSVASWAEQESSVQRLEQAQEGMAEASWPKKPDTRLSPLSGKIKDTSEISPRFFGQDKEFRTRSWGDQEKEANPSGQQEWRSPGSRRWEEARWNQAGEWSQRGSRNQKFQAPDDSAPTKLLSYRELGRDTAPDWSSRSSSLGGGSEGSLRMYEGRLTRVREQVRHEEQNVRDLGSGRQEKFSPQEVEKMLSEPVGELRGTVTGQSAGASLPLAAGN